MELCVLDQIDGKFYDLSLLINLSAKSFHRMSVFNEEENISAPAWSIIERYFKELDIIQEQEGESLPFRHKHALLQGIAQRYIENIKTNMQMND